MSKISIFISDLTVGGAIATGVAIVIYNSLWLFFIYKKVRVHPFTLSYLKAGLAGLVSIALVFFGLDYIFPHPSILIYVLAFFLFAVLYSILSLSLGVLDSEDLMIFNAVERKLGIDLGFVRRLIKKFI